MFNTIARFLVDNPFLMYVLFVLFVSVVIVVLAVLIRVVLRGGKIATPWLTVEPPVLPKESKEELEVRVTQKFGEVGKDEIDRTVFAYNPPPLPERAIKILTAQYDIQQRVMMKVLKTGGGWAGVSLASFETFLTNGETVNAFSSSLAKDIRDYLSYTEDTHLFVNNGEMFNQAQYLAASIVLRLEQGNEEHKYWRG